VFHVTTAREILREKRGGKWKCRRSVFVLYTHPDRNAMQSGLEGLTFKGNSAVNGHRNTVETLCRTAMAIASCVEFQA
jgi:hypothetical protein